MSIGDEAADFMAQVGKPLLPWQRDVVRDAYGIRPDGKWAAYEVALLESRQNGKGLVTETQELFGLFMLREQQIIHSAHLFDTSREAFMRLVDLIEGSDWLSQRTARIDRAHGKEGIRLTRSAGGGHLKFKARTLHGTRGFSGGRIILDEAYGLTVGQFSAISPILATLPNPQITYTSTPPDEKTGPMPEDAMLPSVRRRGLAGDPRMVFYEWSPDEGFDVNDLDVWYQCNPSLGYLIDEEFLATQLRIFQAAGKPQNFATEHLGVWPPDPETQWLVISQSDFDAACDSDSSVNDPVSFAVTLSTDRQWCSITAAGARPDGLLHVEIIDRRHGTGWVIPRLRDLVAQWKPCATVIDKGSPAGSLAAEAEEAGLELTPITTRDVAAAAGAFFDGIAGRPAPDPETDQMGRDPRVIRHRGQPELTAAVAAAVKRPLSGAWAWDQLAAVGDIAPLIGASNALWGYMTRPARTSFEPWVLYA